MLLAAIAVLSGRAGSASKLKSLPPKTDVNLIAYVDLDARIYTVKPDGSDSSLVTPEEGFFTWPTWSPDGRRLVFSGITTPRGYPRINLYAFNTASRHTRQIYFGEPGVARLLAEGVLHYPMWAPDSRRLAFIVGTSQGLTLFVDDLEDKTYATPVLDQGPLWMSWSSDSRHLAIHRGLDHFLLNVQSYPYPKVSSLGIQSEGYRVPAWKPFVDSITLASDDSQGQYAIFTADLEGDGVGTPRQVDYAAPIPALLWSPDGQHLAVASDSQALLYQGLTLFVYQELRLLPADASRQTIHAQDNILACFWSPNGVKLACATLSDRTGILRWMLLDTRDESWRPLVDFVPSLDQLTMFQFFDQYAHSHILWSPDSASLVFSGRVAGEAATASLGRERALQEPQVIVMDVGPNSVPRIIAEGALAFWSPR